MTLSAIPSCSKKYITLAPKLIAEPVFQDAQFQFFCLLIFDMGVQDVQMHREGWGCRDLVTPGSGLACNSEEYRSRIQDKKNLPRGTTFLARSKTS